MYDVAIVGTGPNPSNPTLDGFAMGYRHAEAYRNNDDSRIVACADIVPENGAAFADEFDIDEEYVFEDYHELLATVEPDVVSVAVPPAIHEEIVVGCARGGAVDAIHCEKPMGHTWASAQRMVQSCWRSGVQLTFNRQRRFGRAFVRAKRLLEDGEIGRLERVSAGETDLHNLQDILIVEHSLDLETDPHLASHVAADVRTDVDAPRRSAACL